MAKEWGKKVEFLLRYCGRSPIWCMILSAWSSNKSSSLVQASAFSVDVGRQLKCSSSGTVDRLHPLFPGFTVTVSVKTSDCFLIFVKGLVFYSRSGSTGFSVRACEPRVPCSNPDIRWPLFCLWYYCWVAKDYPNCCHTVFRRNFTMLYAFEAVAAVASLVLNIFKRERKHSRRHYKKSKPMPNNGQEAVHLSLHKANWCHRFLM